MKNTKVSDKTLVVVSSFFVALVYILSCSRICYTALDIWIFLFGTLAIMLGPMFCYIYSVKKEDKHG